MQYSKIVRIEIVPKFVNLKLQMYTKWDWTGFVKKNAAILILYVWQFWRILFIVYICNTAP
jgi:hypothetical protein